jgi:hypothetical protein
MIMPMAFSPDDLQIIDFTRQLLRKNRIDESLAQGGHQTGRRGYNGAEATDVVQFRPLLL